MDNLDNSFKQDLTCIITEKGDHYVVNNIVVESNKLYVVVYNTQTMELQRVKPSKIHVVFNLISTQYINLCTQVLNALRDECPANIYNAINCVYERWDRQTIAENYNNNTELSEEFEHYLNLVATNSNDELFKSFCTHFYKYYLESDVMYSHTIDINWFNRRVELRESVTDR